MSTSRGRAERKAPAHNDTDYSRPVYKGELRIKELAEANQRVTPDRLLDLGHRFRQPSVTDALSHQLGR